MIHSFQAKDFAHLFLDSHSTLSRSQVPMFQVARDIRKSEICALTSKYFGTVVGHNCRKING